MEEIQTVCANCGAVQDVVTHPMPQCAACHWHRFSLRRPWLYALSYNDRQLLHSLRISAA